MELDKKDELIKLLRIFQLEDNFIITTHKNADADGIGSELGLEYLLGKFGKTRIILNPEPLGEKLEFLDIHKKIRSINEEQNFSIPENPKVVILDNSNISRIGEVEKFLKPDKSNLIIIDHHDGIQPFEGLFCFPEISSTSEIIYELTELANLELDTPTASAIYAGIVMDTGQFKYSKTQPRTHEIAAILIGKYGVKAESIIRQMFEDSSHKVLLFKKDVFSTLQVFPENELATVEIPQALMQKYGFTSNPLEGITNELLSPKDIKIAVTFIEQDAETVKISFRSKDDYDVCEIAKRYDGGGHKNASGALVKGKLEHVKQEITEILKSLKIN